VPKNNKLERMALSLVLEAGEEGILQSDMWKSLGVTSREGSRLAIKFEEKGAVERRKVLHKGRWTYKLFSQTKAVTIARLTIWIDPNLEPPEVPMEEPSSDEPES